MLVSSEGEERLQLNMCCFPQQSNIQPKMPVLPRMRNCSKSKAKDLILERQHDFNLTFCVLMTLYTGRSFIHIEYVWQECSRLVTSVAIHFGKAESGGQKLYLYRNRNDVLPLSLHYFWKVSSKIYSSSGSINISVHTWNNFCWCVWHMWKY